MLARPSAGSLLPSATAALDNLTVTARALGDIFAGKGTLDSLRTAFLGAGPAANPTGFDKCFQDTQQWLRDSSPLAKQTEKAEDIGSQDSQLGEG